MFAEITMYLHRAERRRRNTRRRKGDREMRSDRRWCYGTNKPPDPGFVFYYAGRPKRLSDQSSEDLDAPLYIDQEYVVMSERVYSGTRYVSWVKSAANAYPNVAAEFQIQGNSTSNRVESRSNFAAIPTGGSIPTWNEQQDDVETYYKYLSGGRLIHGSFRDVSRCRRFNQLGIFLVHECVSPSFRVKIAVKRHDRIAEELYRSTLYIEKRRNMTVSVIL